MRARSLILLVAGITALATAASFLPVGSWAGAIVDWIRSAGFVGVIGFALLYLAAALLLLPGSVLTLGAGFAYGPLWGTLLVSPVSVTAAVLAFLLGRTALRRRVERRFGQSRRFKAVDEAIERGGFRIVLLVRLSPVFPYNVTNYALGLTRVSLCDYALASLVGMLPGTILYVYLGSVAKSAADVAAGGALPAAWQVAIYAAGLLAALAVTWIVTRTAKRALREEAPEATGRAADTSKEAA